MDNCSIKELSYNDIALVPSKCSVNSRSECDTSVIFGGRKFKLPVYPANMKSVIDEQTCKFLAERGYFYTMHRFGLHWYAFGLEMRRIGLFVSISLGLKEIEKHISNLTFLRELEPEYITLDIANAWTDRTKNAIKKIKNIVPDSFLIVGNVATREAMWELQEWGADAIKIGIASGHVCSTGSKTGFHRPMASCLIDCQESVIPGINPSTILHKPIIADGGISSHGDIAKALVLGAHMVMAGYLFSGFDESSGNIIELDGKQYKEYFGSASEYSKEEQKHIEGHKILVPYRGSMVKLLNEIQEDLQSAISYAGGKDLSVFKTTRIIRV